MPISSRDLIWSKFYLLDSAHFGFFADFHWNNLEINIYNLCYNLCSAFCDIMLPEWAISSWNSSKMKSTKYSTEKTIQKAEKYQKIGERKTRVCLLAGLLAWYQWRNFLLGFTENSFCYFWPIKQHDLFYMIQFASILSRFYVYHSFKEWFQDAI